MTTAPEIIFDRAEALAPIGWFRDGQLNQLFVELDCERCTLDMGDKAGNEVAVPEAVAHGRVLRFPVRESMDGREALALLKQLRPIAEEIILGFEPAFDGESYVGRFSVSAKAAIERVEELCEATLEEEPDGEVWTDGDDWFVDGVPPLEEGQTIEEAAAYYIKEARQQGVILGFDVVSYLREAL